MKNNFWIAKKLGVLPKYSNVDFYGGDYGVQTDVRLINVPSLPKSLLVGNPLNDLGHGYKTSSSVLGYGNNGISMTIEKKELNKYFEVPFIHLRNTYKYAVFKIWFTLPIGDNIEFKVYTIGADSYPQVDIFKHNSLIQNKATQSLFRAYPNGVELKEIKLPEIAYNGLTEETAICAEVEFTPFETIFKYNGIEVNRIKETVDNQQKLVLSLLPIEFGDVHIERPAYIRRITVECKHKKSII